MRRPMLRIMRTLLCCLMCHIVISSDVFGIVGFTQRKAVRIRRFGTNTVSSSRIRQSKKTLAYWVQKIEDFNLTRSGSLKLRRNFIYLCDRTVHYEGKGRFLPWVIGSFFSNINFLLERKWLSLFVSGLWLWPAKVMVLKRSKKQIMKEFDGTTPFFNLRSILLQEAVCAETSKMIGLLDITVKTENFCCFSC
jgi:hypothetical protein